MKHFTYVVLAAAALVASLALVACGGDDAAAPAAGTTATTMETTEEPTETGGTAGVSVESPATDLRVTLNRLLGEHALLAIAATQKGYDGDPDFEAAAAALDQNSVELSEAIASVYGEEAGTQFLDGDLLWRDHIGFFVDYTVALANDDTAAQEEAVGNLMGYVEAFSGFLAEATGAPQAGLRDGIEEHVMQLKGQIDAFSQENYEEAYSLTREAYHHMGMTGDVLAGAIVAQNPGDFSG